MMLGGGFVGEETLPDLCRAKGGDPLPGRNHGCDD